MHWFTFPPLFSGPQMIFRSRLVCLQMHKVCWLGHKKQMLLIRLSHYETMPHTHTRGHTQTDRHTSKCSYCVKKKKRKKKALVHTRLTLICANRSITDEDVGMFVFFVVWFVTIKIHYADCSHWTSRDAVQCRHWTTCLRCCCLEQKEAKMVCVCVLFSQLGGKYPLTRSYN